MDVSMLELEETGLESFSEGKFRLRHWAEGRVSWHEFSSSGTRPQQQNLVLSETVVRISICGWQQRTKLWPDCRKQRQKKKGACWPGASGGAVASSLCADKHQRRRICNSRGRRRTTRTNVIVIIIIIISFRLIIIAVLLNVTV